MRRSLFLGALIVAACVGFIGWRTVERSSAETFTESTATPPEAAPLCPWREPESDLNAFFPDANRYQAETRILSGLRSELGERLGRAPTGDENALRLYRAFRNESCLGSILTRRVKGDYGAIELVLATETNGNVRGLRLQRLREPEPIANALQDSKWLNSFVGKRADDPWHLGKDIPEVAPDAQSSAGAVIGGVRSLLILLAAANEPQAKSLAETHHH